MTSSGWALRTAGLGKTYQLGRAPSAGTLRYKIAEWVFTPFRRPPGVVR